MFDTNRFVEDCKNAVGEGQGAIREIVARAIADPGGIMAQLGEPTHAGIAPIYKSPSLTIINFVWAPYMSLMPHNHRMFSVVGIYSGREDNIFWRRSATAIEVVGATSLGTGDIATLDREAIHSVLNPIGKMTCAIHVYGGNFFQPEEPRSQWDHETLIEEAWNIEKIKSLFQDAETRFNAVAQRS